MLSFLLFLYGFISILWSIILFPLSLFGIRMYHIKSNQIVSQIIANLPDRSTIYSDNGMRGWIWGIPYIGYILDNESSHQNGASIYILTTISFYNKISRMFVLDDIITTDTRELTIYNRDGNWSWMSYVKTKVNVDVDIPYQSQDAIITSILQCLENQHYCVAYIHGKPGSGKSSIGTILATTLNGSYCYTFRPIEPRDTFSDLYNTVNPSKENPLIVVLEEADTIIKQIHSNSISQHRTSPIQIKDKTGWNVFFDKFKFYKNTILILTSNTSNIEIDNIDPSYLRTGRVDIIAHIEDQNNYNIIRQPVYKTVEKSKKIKDV